MKMKSVKRKSVQSQHSIRAALTLSSNNFKQKSLFTNVGLSHSGNFYKHSVGYIKYSKRL